MKAEIELNEMTLWITDTIRADHPELLKNLNEMTKIQSHDKNLEINLKTLAHNYGSLAVILEKFEKRYNKDLPPNMIEEFRSNKIIQ